MRILHLYKDYHPPVRGGIEQTVELMARHQVRSGHEVTVLTSAHGGRRTLEEMVEGVRVIRVAEWARFASAPLCPTMPLRLSRLGAEMYHLHFPSPPGEVSWLLVRPRAAMVVTYHSDIVRQVAALAIYRPVVHALLKAADIIMPTSEPYIERSEFLRPHRGKCMVVPHGVDLGRFADMNRHRERAAALRAKYGTPITLFVGRLRYYKGLDVLLPAMRSVPGTLLLVGDGPEGEHLHSLRETLGLDKRVVFAGAVDEGELLAHLAAADVGVLPSTLPSEAYGMALVEMLACGVPAVCTELGTGTSFVNRHEETGLVVPPGDPAALAAALGQLHGDPALRQRMGEAGQRRAREVLSVEAMMRGVEKAYALALERRQAAVPKRRGSFLSDVGRSA
jgi:rhamnosyl/mannosyltransferase